MGFMERIVDHEYLECLRNSNWHNKQISNLMVDISLHGMKKPGILEYKDHILTLQDGNHRYLACRDLQMRTFRVEFHEVTEPHTKRGVDVSVLLPDLLQNYYYGTAGN